MPELPEVEIVRRGLEPALAGARLLRADLRRPDLRFPFPERFAERIAGRRIEALSRRAKYLLADLDDGFVLVMHLGMSGSFRLAGPEAVGADAFHQPRGKNPVHDHVVLHLSNGMKLTYNDPRRFGFMTLVAREALSRHPIFKDIGIEPLGNEFGGDTLARLFVGKALPLKAALLDQRLIAGLGNIYACEALHRAGLSPVRAAGTLATKSGGASRKAHRLAEAVRLVLEEALAAGGSSLRDYQHADGALGYFQHRFRVYDREHEACPSPGCRGTVERLAQSGRSTFFCRACQK